MITVKALLTALYQKQDNVLSLLRSFQTLGASWLSSKHSFRQKTAVVHWFFHSELQLHLIFLLEVKGLTCY